MSYLEEINFHMEKMASKSADTIKSRWGMYTQTNKCMLQTHNPLPFQSGIKNGNVSYLKP